jgi:hypothetical protein
MTIPRVVRAPWWLAAILLLAPSLHGYSVLTHEAIVDSLWNDSIVPLLKKRFPAVTADELLQAHAYAYGGAIIPDMGYFPFGSKLFSDLAHYVRSGDFVTALIRDSETLDEYAFALGSLAHYSADTVGHPEAINLIVPVLYPKLKVKYGKTVTYENDPAAHLKTEFGFDVLEVAHGRYASKAYHDFIGFQVAKPVLERAFLETYSLELKDIFMSVDLALGTYRRTVASILPEMTRVAWHEKRDEIQKTQPGATKQKFYYNLSRSSYEKEWGHDYERPGLGARFIAFLFRIVPKVGPFKALSYRMPDTQSEKVFMTSFNDTVTRYRELLRQSAGPRLQLPDRNMDTGAVAERGTYKLADRAYEQLLEKLADNKHEVSPILRITILKYYGNSDALTAEKARREYALFQKWPVGAGASPD